MHASINGKIVDQNEAKISVFDRGYLFGEGLFETLRSYDGKLPFFDKHLARLEWSCTYLDLPFPHPELVRRSILDLLKANDLKDARIRVMVTGVNVGLKPHLLTEKNETNVVILCEAFQPLSDSDYEQGVDLITVHSIRNDPPPASNIKSLSYGVKMMARKEILEKDAFDGILLDAHGKVTETTSANLFWVKNQTVYTSPISIGLLPGVTRDILIPLVTEEGLLFREAVVENLKEADEVFLSNAIIEILPVTEIDGEAVGAGAVGDVTAQLIGAYHKRIEEEKED